MISKQLGIKLSALTLALMLAGCGGGGSDGYYNNDGSSSGNITTNPSTGEEVKSVNISTIQLIDRNGNLTQAIAAEGVSAQVKVTDQSGKGISGALVTFTVTGGVVLGSSNGAVLTNTNGEASISVKPENLNTNGAYQISAVADFDGTEASTPALNFSLQATNIILVDLTAASTQLESGGSTNITLKTQDANTKVNQNNVNVEFTAPCGKFEPATVVSSNQGNVTTTYKAIGTDGKLCTGTQKISATGLNIPEVGIDVSIKALEANSLVYTSNKVNLGIRKSGSASSGQIEFTLYANGVPIADQDVLIEKVQAPEDLSFVSFGNQNNKTIKSDSNGKVIVNLYPGDKPGPVEIRATLVSDKNVSAVSKNVSVSIGRVTQDGLSLSVSKNSLQNVIDGDTATITARMVDRTRNPVPDGTVISFVSEGGKVEPNCSTVQGVCSVTLTTQEPRPLDNRVTVLAYVEGDKSFTDLDGDNLYTKGVDRLLSNIGSFFRDDNEDNQYNKDYGIGEFLYNRAVLGNKATCAPSTIRQPNIADTCDDNLDTVIRQQLLFAFAENTPTFTNVKASGSLLSFNMYGNSAQSVPMPTGTTISVTPEDNTKANNLSCTAELATGSSPVANVFDLLTPSTFKNSNQSYYGYRLKECAVGDTLKVSVSSPDSKVSTIYVDYQ
ncbi:hypothetical protein WCE14_15280 [Acinetobacter schindleri]|uniref:Big-1 domain-containing protein n=1 Tax=Acinetobacter schindleri NIPH 900 TaxID=1217675 RepID=N8XYZ1_9GAMM|nr:MULTISPECIES: hypothetical protein [Acinetobacter]EIM39320.1 hypothetical protein HADU_07380 [Acinetobacter sp. HA]ENV12583.1 hypothetical protein F965_02216 [Acinetobacter schindleri NIPH 900]OIJ33876.1 hypothetical protein BK820_14455 [Acinetobacter sp. LCT-H3]